MEYEPEQSFGTELLEQSKLLIDKHLLKHKKMSEEIKRLQTKNKSLSSQVNSLKQEIRNLKDKERQETLTLLLFSILLIFLKLYILLQNNLVF